ncbi:hypothetical protein SISNIDRAFT_452785 [Sistotremastrum niveocremeum HHB9708]|uniref:DNA-directed RNA polymerases I and III subunit RPAC1 n=2 Tax=Sistotremastraceae TaxID=3402574 RepID=A0A164W2S6_9AGAM|nr:hypothetical protein SISNIDRAFT_452785 [Sistotremastrum niveocremeum HHB9708]KZT38188.1 hypothetical protein SISSUDRAFT_1047420 [Sistotremastrum suecicum HHB10207 ss-3]
MPSAAPPSDRNLVGVHKEYVSNVSSTDYPGHYPGEDHSWDLGLFNERCRVQVQRLSQRSIEFDLVGVDASVANALRRVIIAEVPTVAIEQVYVWNNTSVIVDEVLSHRLGLVPLNVDPRLLEFRSTDPDVPDIPTDQNTMVFRLNVRCERNPAARRDETDPEVLYRNSNVLASHITWVPQVEQATTFAKLTPASTKPNIVLAKLRPGQEIELEMHATKNIGMEHAKWSPVATASYRLLPLIILKAPIPPHLCRKFAKCFAPGVVEVVKNSRTGQDEVKIVNPRKDTVSREVLRHEEFEGLVELKRQRDFFIFNIESEGPYSPEELLPEAITTIRNKIKVIRDAAQKLVVDMTIDT